MGRTVRCSRCSHEWHAPREVDTAVGEPLDINALLREAPQAEAETIVPPEAPSESNDDFFAKLEAELKSAPGAEPSAQIFSAVVTTPARKPKLTAKPFKIAVPLLAACWLAAALVTYFPRWQEAPVLKNIYQALGVTPTDGLIFSDVAMEREQNGAKTKFILSGSIRNHSSQVRKVPTVRVTLRDKNNKAIWGREYPVNKELKGGEVYPFRIANVETSFASNVSTIVVDIGNSLQLLVR
jgi:hypothetical protein